MLKAGCLGGLLLRLKERLNMGAAASSGPVASRPPEKDESLQQVKKNNKVNKKKGTVFLGGACGDSTWRAEVAIPLLNMQGTPYFDPQVPAGKWTPAMMEEENRAKEDASVLLFVIDGSTRGIMSIAELAFYLGCGRTCVAFIQDVSDKEEPGTGYSKAELADLNRGRKYLRTLFDTSVARQSKSKLCSDLSKAIEHAGALA